MRYLEHLDFGNTLAIAWMDWVLAVL